MELELKHLRNYLGCNLKCSIHSELFPSPVLTGINGIFAYLNYHGASLSSEIEKIKSLLRPLLDLTKEIDINGEKFVPIVELAKIAYPDLVWEFDRTRAISEWKKEPAYFFFQKNSFFACLFNNAIPNQIVLFNKLFEWHFDVFGLIDQGLARPLI